MPDFRTFCRVLCNAFIAMFFVCPVMAEQFPNDGLMQANTTYENAANETNMDGVYADGDTVNALANYNNLAYNITYVSRYESNEIENNASNPSTYTTSNLSITLKNPTHDDYIFVGWCTDAELTNCSLSQTIAAGTTGDKTFYAHWEPAKFTLTTSATDEFKFLITAGGTFYVDCGDNGVLKDSRDVVLNSTITRVAQDIRSTNYNYKCVWSSENMTPHTIRFGGKATTYFKQNIVGYTWNGAMHYYSAIRFSINVNLCNLKDRNGNNIGKAICKEDANAKKITGISGSLGRIFGTTADGDYPQFFRTFAGAVNMEYKDPTGNDYALPPDLFDGITGTGVGMFANTFANCHGLKGKIPPDLFASVHGTPKNLMFLYTFADCKNLYGLIPESLFCHALATGETPNATNCIYGAPSDGLFRGTFVGCTNLGLDLNGNPITNEGYAVQGYALPPKLFFGLRGAPQSAVFFHTFNGCSGLTGKIPEELFCQGNALGQTPNATNCIYGIASYVFAATFGGPDGWGDPSGPEVDNLGGCTGLIGPIPAKLFAGIHGAPQYSMYRSTFQGCTGLAGKIPESLFCYALHPDINESPDANTNCIVGTPQATMFMRTFQGCANLTGFTDGTNETTYVPGTFLENIIKTGSTEQTVNMFTGTALDDVCPLKSETQPVGTFNVTRSQFSTAGKPWCSPCPENFPNIVAGATDASQCYAMCPTMENATAASGGVYQDGTNTCEITECKDGFVLENSACVGKTINIDWVGTNDSDVSNGANMCIYGGTITAPSAASAINPPRGKKFVGWRVKKS